MIYDKIMKFGYHDTDVTGISYDESRIILDFEKGIYDIDALGREKCLTSFTKIIITVDTRYAKITNCVEIFEIGRKFKTISLETFCNLVKKSTLGIDNVYYSRLNSIILFECGIKDKIYMFHIDGCTKFDVLFPDK